MTATMTWVGLDVHARSTHAAAIDRDSGELARRRFGTGAEPVVAWLQALPQPIHACYEAGPTGYALDRAAESAGLCVDVVAPSKTPRAASDRVKTDRKDAELLVRLLLAGSLTPVAVPSPEFEAARDLARSREQVRADLARLRHRVSKLLLRYGRVYERSSWTQAHRRWLAAQRFEHVPTELAYLDSLAAIDGLLSRRAALDERLSQLAREDRSEGIEIIRTPIRAPRANAHAERFVGTMRRECLDWLLIVNRRQLAHVLRTYIDHYNRCRPHRALGLGTPIPRAAVQTHPPLSRLERRDVLGGLLHEYALAA